VEGTAELTSEHHHSTPEYWESLYAGGATDAPVDVLLPEVIADLSPGKALDIGCGEGQNSKWLAEKGWSVLGVDLSPTAIRRARAAATGAVEFFVADGREWEPGSRFDLVVSTYALPSSGHGRVALLAMAAAAVGPGGTAYVVEFDESTEGLWHPEDLASLDELVAAFDGFSLTRAEVVTLPHVHGHDGAEYPMAVLVAQRSE
jgi:SAM-dependent methyltransferase